MGKTPTSRMLFGFVLISAINRHGQVEEMKLFKKYVDDIICTVRGDEDEHLKIANSLHKNLQFIKEKKKMEGDLAFLHINVNLSSENKITCHWYQKRNDTGIKLNFHRSA